MEVPKFHNPFTCFVSKEMEALSNTTFCLEPGKIFGASGNLTEI